MRQIGPYQILEELGRGAMGVVYRAVDPAIDRQVAIKIIRSHEFDSPEEISEAGVRLAREASASGRLSHPNIVALYQFGQEPDFEYIAMEFVPGSSLDKLLKGGKQFSSGEVLDIIRQVAAALDHAHANGVIHRDIKPANILARPDGVVKVTDFGIARLTSQTITREGAAMGTPAYMAPEQIQGSKVDARADQFSLGVVAYQLFAGKPPFTADSDMALMMQIMNAEPASLPDAKVDRVLRRALAKDPGRRFTSCGEFAAALDSAFSTAETFDPEATVRSLPLVVKRKSRIGWVIAACCAAGLGVAYVEFRTPSPVPVAPKAAAVHPVVEQRDPIVNDKDGLRYVWIPSGSFWIGQTEVTQAAYRRVMHASPSHFEGDQLPVESVSWKDADSYCKAIRGRLPTEAEWELAAGKDHDDPGLVAWYRDNSNSSTHVVGRKRPNVFGLYDMRGNVWEWVEDYGDLVRGGSYANGAQSVSVGSRRTADDPNLGVGFRCAGDFR